MGCFAKGCLTTLIICFIFVVGLIGVGWYLFVKTLDNLTSLAPSDVRIEQPTDSQFQAAENVKARLKQAIANNQETTVEFTAADLNALLARDPDLEDLHGRIRVEIADSLMTVAVSAPLHSLPLPKMKKRWFNGTARLGFTYQNSAFDFDIISAEAGGHSVPNIFLSGATISSFNEGFNENFWDEMRKTDRGTEFWSHVKTMSLQGDKLVITTQSE